MGQPQVHYAFSDTCSTPSQTFNLLDQESHSSYPLLAENHSSLHIQPSLNMTFLLAAEGPERSDDESSASSACRRWAGGGQEG